MTPRINNSKLKHQRTYLARLTFLSGYFNFYYIFGYLDHRLFLVLRFRTGSRFEHGDSLFRTAHSFIYVKRFDDENARFQSSILCKEISHFHSLLQDKVCEPTDGAGQHQAGSTHAPLQTIEHGASRLRVACAIVHGKSPAGVGASPRHLVRMFEWCSSLFWAWARVAVRMNT